MARDPTRRGIPGLSFNPILVTGRIYDEDIVTSKWTGAAGKFFAGLPVAQPYAARDGSTAFSTVWAASGARSTEGGFAGMITSVASGGTNKPDLNYARCKGTVSGRLWHASCSGPGQ
jgi:hypothetical protein